MEVSEIAEHTKAVIAHNDLSEKVEVIQDYAENLDLDEPVDLIISEWMGTVLVVIFLLSLCLKIWFLPFTPQVLILTHQQQFLAPLAEGQ